MIKKKFTGLILADIHCSGEGDDLPIKGKIARDLNDFFDRIKLDSIFRFRNQLKTAAETMQRLRGILDKYMDRAEQVFIAGDITDMGRDSEYKSVIEALADYDSRKISVVPGNHEYAQVYMLKKRRKLIRKFKNIFENFLPPTPEPSDSDLYYPYVKEIGGDFVVFGLDTGLAPLQGPSKGLFGPEQLDRLETLLDSGRFDGMHKIMLMHHDVSITDRDDLDYVHDRDRFVDILNIHNIGPQDRNITVICGHTHTEKFGGGNIGNINFIAGPYFCSRTGNDFLLFEINEDGIAARLNTNESAG